MIDPAIVYSTYVGGINSGSPQDTGKDIAVDASGGAYITGATSSPDFPTTAGAYQSALVGGSDAFVTKVDTNASGAGSLKYSTYLGGNGVDAGQGIAVDGSGNAYVTGSASSVTFPTLNPLPATSCSDQGTAFVTKFNAAGSGLVYSTCVGAPNVGGAGAGIAVDASGAAYITGTTGGAFPTTAGAYQSSPGGGGDAFVAKLQPMASAGLAYSTYLGGAGDDQAADIAVDGPDNAYVTGLAPAGFPTTALAFQTANAGGTDAFVAKINTAASGAGSLAYSTYLGGSADDPFTEFFSGADPPEAGIAVKDGNAYVTGNTGSTNFPTQGALQASLGGGGQDAFVAKLNTSGTALVYSTYLGGTGFDQSTSVAVDSAGSAHVLGFTLSSSFPTADPLPGSTCAKSIFVSKLSPAGSALSYSTCIPGAELASLGGGIAVDAAGNAYAAGTTGQGQETQTSRSSTASRTSASRHVTCSSSSSRRAPSAARVCPRSRRGEARPRGRRPWSSRESASRERCR